MTGEPRQLRSFLNAASVLAVAAVLLGLGLPAAALVSQGAGLLMVLVAVVLVGIAIHLALREGEPQPPPPSPNLSIGDPVVAPLGPDGRYVRVPVVNDPRDPRVRAEGAYARLRIEAPDGTVLAEDQRAPWADAPQAAAITIEPNGWLHYLDTVMHESSGAGSMWLYDGTRREGIREVWPAPEPQADLERQGVLMHLVVKGSNFDPLFASFRLYPDPLHESETASAAAEGEASGPALLRTAQGELVAVIDDGNALFTPIFETPYLAPYKLWRDKAAAFLEAVFGAAERQRFLESYHPPPDGLTDTLKHHLRRLADLRDRPETWELRVDDEGVRRAADQRGFRTKAEQIVEAGVEQPEAELPPEKVADFKHFAQELAGWFKSWQLEAPPDPMEYLGEEYEEEARRDQAEGVIAPQEYLRKVQPFTEYRKWASDLRADYQRTKRADAVRWVEWAHESGVMKHEDFMVLILVKDPQADDLKELVETVERMAKGF